MESTIKALDDPIRRKILEMLKEKPLSVGEILSKLEISGATLSHHLKILRNADLVSCRRDGNSMIYQINTSVVEDVITWLIGFTNKGGKNE
ncbi:MAG: autorepressor SdpR family transcription factor [Sphaerochaetaceae bacterium]|nr:autorepressor SdpR family transcription factor [Sphaerochaetaceae bacterium]